MTEEIIIDGINVAGCYWKCKDGDCAMYYADLSADNNELEFGFNCEDNPDCYYKQLKRLEQERDELKKQNAILLGQLVINDGEDVTVQISQSQFDEYNELKQENKALKDNNNHLQVIIDDGRAENKRFREENKELKAYKDVNEDFKKAWDELNKKYTEVLKLAKENADSNEYCLQELEKENKELKEQLLEDKILDEEIENLSREDVYRSALEDIRDYLYTLTTIDTDFVNTETFLRINDKIEEVLNEGK